MTKWHQNTALDWPARTFEYIVEAQYTGGARLARTHQELADAQKTFDLVVDRASLDWAKLYEVTTIRSISEMERWGVTEPEPDVPLDDTAPLFVQCEVDGCDSYADSGSDQPERCESHWVDEAGVRAADCYCSQGAADNMDVDICHHHRKAYSG